MDISVQFLEKGLVVISDFLFAKRQWKDGSEHWLDEAIPGTPSYMAPEQAAERRGHGWLV